MKYRIFKWFGLVLILEAGLLHYVASQAAYIKAPYLGYLLVANTFAALVAAVGIYHKRSWGWILGAVLSVGSLIGYVWNSTLGLPQMAPGSWLYPYSIVASVSEVLFLLLVSIRPWKIVEVSHVASSRFSFYLPSLLVIIGLIAFPTYKWDLYANEVGYHKHVGSVQAVCSTPITSEAELEQRYGIKLSLVAMSMMNGVVDVRLKILDPEKASQLMRDQAALLVDQQFLVLAPHMHRHAMLKQNKIHTMFFPTANQKIHAGSQVSLVFGSVRIEAITVK